MPRRGSVNLRTRSATVRGEAAAETSLTSQTHSRDRAGFAGERVDLAGQPQPGRRGVVRLDVALERDSRVLQDLEDVAFEFPVLPVAEIVERVGDRARHCAGRPGSRPSRKQAA